MEELSQRSLLFAMVGIQELDGGFFEKFGSLLKDADPEKHLEISKEEVPAESEDEEDSAHEEETKIDLITEAVGLNIEELYSEVLYQVLHIVGCDIAADSDEQEELFLFLQKAFKLGPDRHTTLLETARAKEAPNILLNVEVIEAKELRPKDANGQSDPFCTLFLNSAPTHRYNTSVKDQTLSPVWEEHFSLPVDNPADDILCIEVWDFDPAETVREKITKFGEVKGIKGLRKLMKEIAVTASTGKHDNELIGCSTLPLKSISATGQTLWVNLEKKSKVKRQGVLKIRITFSSEKNSQVAAQEHRHLLRIFLLHELEITQQQNENEEWNGQFSFPAQTVLRQHLAQSSLTSSDEALACWIEFCNIHVSHPLNYSLFQNILQKLHHPLHNGLLTEEEVKSFWDAAKRLLPSCFTSIKKLRKLPPGEKSTLSHLSAVLSIISTLSSLTLPEGTDLFPANLYGWLNISSDKSKCDIRTTLHDAITQAAIDWYAYITDHTKLENYSSEAQLKQQIKIIQLIRTDLQRAVEYHDRIFLQIMQVVYSKCLYTTFECRVSEMCKPLVTDICLSLKPLRFKDEYPKNGNVENDQLAMGTTLFELYLVLQRFAILGTGLSPTESESFHIQKFHTWFHRGVAHWLDIAVYKAMQRINKAVELDKLEPIDDTVKHSSSAVDTLSIFYQIQKFWQQLAWPDIEGSYTFVAKIMDDICRCSVYYADEMSKRVDNMGVTETVYEKKFEVTNEWCLAINNIDHVKQSIEQYVRELGMDDIVKRLADFSSPTAAEHCRVTLQLVMDNAVDTVKNKILELMEIVVNKMSPSILRFLMEGAELLNQDSNIVDRLMQYLDENLSTLHSQLNPDNFDRILNIVFEKVAKIIYNLFENSLEKKRPPTFFANLNQTLQILIGFIKQFDNPTTDEVMDRIRRLLTLYGLETWDLITQVHLERLAEQRAITTPLLGMLTVRLQFVHNTLRIEIMNARNLRPADSNGSCDPYVKIRLIPEDKFVGVNVPRTKTHKRNLFPLFEESFSVQLTHEQKTVKDGLLQFLVKDQDYFGMRSQFLGEAYFPLSDIASTTMETRLNEMAQIHMKLSKPSNLDSDAMKALEHRQGEKLARDFIKRQKSKQLPQPKIE